MKWTLAAMLVAMAGCATDDPVEPESDSNTADLNLVECMPMMSVSGAGPYSVQCAASYSVTESGAQIAYEATDANGTVWVTARAAAPMPVAPETHGTTIFALQSATPPALGALSVHTRLVDDVQAVISHEISSTIDVRY